MDIMVEIQDVDGARSVVGSPFNPGTYGGGVNGAPWIKRFPIKKVCNARLDTHNAAAGAGRGEFN
jgi:hypothetical protein